jgi:uncharacterized protein YjbI with pentapeptide repeats
VNAQERQIDCVISTKKDLEELVRQALDSGVLDLENCQVKVEFNLVELLLAFEIKKTPYQGKFSFNHQGKDKVYRIRFTVECPFSIKATNATFEKGFVATHEVITTIFTGKADFWSASFTGKTNFSSATFIEKANFSFARFTEKAWFNSATFTGEAGFRYSTFTGEADFSSATFTEVTDFCSAKFTKVAKFSYSTFIEKANFRSARFAGEAWFNSATFTGEAGFSYSTFTGWAVFHSTTFTEHSSFKDAQILGNATLEFDHITTHEYLDIIPSVLKGEIIITDPTLESDRRSLVVDLELLSSPLALLPLFGLFHSSSTHPACFLYFLTLAHQVSNGKIIFTSLEIDYDRICLKVRNLKKMSGAKIHFKKCGFYGKNVAFTNVAMRCVAIQGGNYVSGMSFYHCDWASIYSFLGLKFRAFQGIKSSDKSKIADSYGNLKVSALEAGDAQLSNDFHFWHQWHQWENLYQKRLWNWNNFYRITSAYGMSVRLPLFWFICVIGIFIFCYAPITKVPQLTLMFAFRTSIENSLPLIGWTRSSLFNTHPTQYLLLSIVQHLIQGYLLFQIGAAIRNKVKR